MALAAAKPSIADRDLNFRIGADLYSLAAGKVVEVMRRPAMTRVPHGPTALAGIANLRGVAMPVIAVDRLLGLSEGHGFSGEKVIVYDHLGPIGLLVDDVLSFGKVDSSTHAVTGLEAKLAAAFKPSQRTSAPRLSMASNGKDDTGADSESVSLVCFRAAGQLFALPIMSVHEVLTMSAELSAWPNGDQVAIGIVNLRDRVVPIFSLAKLLGLNGDHNGEVRRVVVIAFENSLVGLAVDALDAIWRLPATSIDPVPEILKRGTGSAEIEAIGRSADGRGLVSILSTHKLLGNTAIRQAVERTSGAASMPDNHLEPIAEAKLLIFELGDEAYGLPIDAVDEVVRVPETITRIPNAPAFVTGVMNLRGKPIPLIDQRLRFDAPGRAAETRKPRAIILTIGKLQAGFIVDGASEVVNVPVSALMDAPSFSSERADVFDRVAHIEADGRMVLLVDPKELLTRAERDVVAAIADTSMAAPGK